MGVRLYKDGAWQVFPPDTFRNRLDEGWKFSDVEEEEEVEEFEEVQEDTVTEYVSASFTLAEASPIIKAFKTVDEVEKFCIGDERDGIQKMAAKRINRLR